MQLWFLPLDMLLRYLDRLRAAPHSVRQRATYIISLSLTAMVTFLWLLTFSFTQPSTQPASVAESTSPSTLQFDVVLPGGGDRKDKAVPATSEQSRTVEDILRARARGVPERPVQPPSGFTTVKPENGVESAGTSTSGAVLTNEEADVSEGPPNNAVPGAKSIFEATPRTGSATLEEVNNL